MIKLLIVDDEKIIRETILNSIPWADIGITPIGCASNGLEAYDIIMDEYPDIVMTDIKMPGLSGLELLKRIKTIHPQVEFVILSGYSEFEYAKEAMQWGVQHYLLKPCNEAQIIESIRSIVENKYHRKIEISSHSEYESTANNSSLLLSILNECIALDDNNNSEDDAGIFETVIHNYNKFIDFDSTSYELCYLYFVDENSMNEAIRKIRFYNEEYVNGIPFHIMYVHQTLLFFFPTYRLYYDGLDQYMKALSLESQHTAPEYEREHFDSLLCLLKKLAAKLKRYEYIYYLADNHVVSICNYRSVIRQIDSLTGAIYDSNNDLETSLGHVASLELLLSSISDISFLRQLCASVMIISASKCISFSLVDATEVLIEIGNENQCKNIVESIVYQVQKRCEDFYSMSVSGKGSISQKIDGYVREHLSDSDLSLKYIAENYLYMNVDYVSKVFRKETGQRFSAYLTDLRIQKAKEILSDIQPDKIINIAAIVGCGNNPQYFSQIFKKATGMTPSAYIKFIQGGDLHE